MAAAPTKPILAITWPTAADVLIERERRLGGRWSVTGGPVQLGFDC